MDKQLETLYGPALLSGISDDLQELLPKGKGDTDTAWKVLERDPADLEPILPMLLTWMQDLNWPVARVLSPYLAKVGLPLVPHLRRVLKGEDVMWQYWIIVELLDVPDMLMARKLSPEISRLMGAHIDPSVREKAESIHKKLGQWREEMGKQLNQLYGPALLSGISDDLLKLLPKGKNDTDTARKVLELDPADIEPILPMLLTWMQDLNWPVARVLAPYLAKTCLLLEADIRNVLKGDDGMWKYWVITQLLDISDLALARKLKQEITRLTKEDQEDSVREQAGGLLKRLS